MKRCENCGRYPAKPVSYSAHRGFVLFRQQLSIEGVFCRDCALSAYAVARGITLKGMWFSPGSLVLGVVGSAWDSAKLLNLPPEVRDEPWMFHKVACPQCSSAHMSLAGLVQCEKCDSHFVIISCPHCGTVHCREANETTSEIVELTCRSCGLRSVGPGPARNWPLLIGVRAIVEIAAAIGVSEKQFDGWCLELANEFCLQVSSWAWIRDYFSHCKREAEFGDVLRLAVFWNRTTSLAPLFSSCRVFVNDLQFVRLKALAGSLGLDPDNIFSEGVSPPDWREILGLNPNATRADVDEAYRELARKYHPDLHQSADSSEREQARKKIREINSAYERAKNEMRTSCQDGPSVQPVDSAVTGKEPQRDPDHQTEHDPDTGSRQFEDQNVTSDTSKPSSQSQQQYSGTSVEEAPETTPGTAANPVNTLLGEDDVPEKILRAMIVLGLVSTVFLFAFYVTSYVTSRKSDRPIVRANDAEPPALNVPAKQGSTASADTVDALIAIFDNPNDDSCKDASQSLLAIGKPAVPALMGTLDCPSVRKRRYAIYTLGKLGPMAVDAIPALATQCQDPDPAISKLATAAINLIVKSTKSALPSWPPPDALLLLDHPD